MLMVEEVLTEAQWFKILMVTVQSIKENTEHLMQFYYKTVQKIVIATIEWEMCLLSKYEWYFLCTGCVHELKIASASDL